MQVIPQPVNILTNQDQWWFIYNSETSLILQPPIQCSGKTSSPHTMIITDTEAESEEYIIQNNLS